jgi:hypothetical protein
MGTIRLERTLLDISDSFVLLAWSFQLRRIVALNSIPPPDPEPMHVDDDMLHAAAVWC